MADKSDLGKVLLELSEIYKERVLDLTKIERVLEGLSKNIQNNLGIYQKLLETEKIQTNSSGEYVNKIKNLKNALRELNVWTSKEIDAKKEEYLNKEHKTKEKYNELEAED